MNRDITSIYKAYARSNRLHPIILMSATFDSGALNLWNGYQTLNYDGVNYTGSGNLINISASAETEELKANGLQVSLNGISTEIISIALNQAVSGRPISIKMGFLSGDPQEILEYAITVSGGKYYIEQELTPKLYVIRGQTYKFNQSDSTNATHNLRLSRTSDGTHGGGTQYSDGWTEVRVEQVTNGTFDTNTDGWTTSSGASASVTSGIVTITASQYHTFSQNLDLESGKTYTITLVSTEENGSWFLAMHNGTSVFSYVNVAVGTQTLSFTASSATNQLRLYPYSSGSSSLKVDSVSVVGDVTAQGNYNQWVVPKLSSTTTNYDVSVVANSTLYGQTPIWKGRVNSSGTSIFGNVFYLNKTRIQSPMLNKSTYFSFPQGSITGNASGSRTSSYYRTRRVAFKGTVKLLSSYTKASCIYELGGTTSGAWLGISEQSGAYFLRARAGTGTDGLNTSNGDVAIGQVAITDYPAFFDNAEHEIIFAIDFPSAIGGVRVWIDGTLVVNAETTDASAFGSSEWADTGGGGYISGISGTPAGGDTDTGSTQFQAGVNYESTATGTFDATDLVLDETILPIELLEGQTYRFTQSSSDNDGHPLFITTSYSTTLSDVQNAYVTQGVSYYIDGDVTFSDYTNTTTFNAGTTRYLEFTPESSGTFYIACYVHGIGMGFQLNVLSTSTFYYYCQNHSGMGGEINVSNDFVLFEPFTLFNGQMDKMNIEDTGETANVSINCESKLISLQDPRVRRYTLEDQKLNFPNDKGLEFIPSLQNKDITWGRG